jgi:hypothetical protein
VQHIQLNGFITTHSDVLFNPILLPKLLTVRSKELGGTAPEN